MNGAATAHQPAADPRPSLASQPALLDAEGVSMAFGGVTALDNAYLRLEAGGWLGLIGPNGSGKTTLLNVLSGMYKPQHGRIALGGKDLTRSGPRYRAAHGIVRSFQQPQLAASLTIAENVELGAELLRRRKSRDSRHGGADAIDMFGLGDHAHLLPPEAPYGVRKTAELARAVAGDPSILLLDEPAAGLSSEERAELVTALKRLRSRSPELCVCLVEHDIRFVTSLASRLQVLNFGKVIAAGEAALVLADPVVQEAYLGRSRYDAEEG